MNTKLVRLVSLFLILTFILTGFSQPVVAQDDRPGTQSPSVEEFPSFEAGRNGPRAASDDPELLAQDYREEWQQNTLPEGTGGPDEYGYTWDDSEPLSWIDVSGGIDTGINDSDSWAGPFNIGWDFKYYENVYNQIYITRHGYILFDEPYYIDSQSPIPDPNYPNNVIAPYWSPIYEVNGYVKYQLFGTQPDRYLVVEWNQVGNSNSGELLEYTFELILHENGDIVFQYQNMDDEYWCSSSGIENSDGLDGLSTTPWCYFVDPMHAVRITRPAPAARLKILQEYYGALLPPGGVDRQEITIKNIGELGADTYDLFPVSTWPITLYAGDGVTPLTDTDMDGDIDTGTVPQGESVTIVSEIIAPAGLAVGSSNTAYLTVQSSVDINKSKMLTIQNAVPTSFAQVVTYGYQSNIHLIKSDLQVEQVASSSYVSKYAPSITELADGYFFYAWNESHCADDYCNFWVTDIRYALLNPYGEVIRNGFVTDLTGSHVDTYDMLSGVAAAPDGSIGISWIRQMVRYTPDYAYNMNVYSAIQSPDGRLFGPVNITNNNLWGDSNDSNFPRYYEPSIAATGDNRFVIGWDENHYVYGTPYQDYRVYNLYYTIYNTAGSLIKPVTQFTFDQPSDQYDGYYDITISSLTNNRVLFAYYRDWDGEVYYAVLDSSGNTVRDKTALEDANSYAMRPDAVQLPNGNIIIAWTGESWSAGGYYFETNYAVLNGAYNRIFGPAALQTPAAKRGNYGVSVTCDQDSRAVLTWTDYNWTNIHNIYYALLSGTGIVLTQPMIMLTDDYFDISYTGYGNTTYNTEISTETDNYVEADQLVPAAPGGTAHVQITFGNHGQALAENAILTATLDANLTYLGDSLGIPPTVDGNTVVWQLPDIEFLERVEFELYFGIPESAPIGTTYPYELEIASSGVEVNPVDNTTSGHVWVALFTYLPVIVK